MKGYAAHERQTLAAVVDARSKATSMNVDADDLTPERWRIPAGAGGRAFGAGASDRRRRELSRSEANSNFQELQAQLEGTENRIAVARTAFNEKTQAYNVAVRRFPANLVAGILSFGQKPYFEADDSAAQAPEVAF